MSGDNETNVDTQALLAAAREAAGDAYAPYSSFSVGAALLFADGAVVTGANVENASFGLSLCAETVAAAKAMNAGARGGLVAIAVVGPAGGNGAVPISPCGRCRQVLNELAALGDTDPVIVCEGADEVHLSSLLPRAFGPASLA